MTTHTVLLAEEPTLFDTATKSLSAQWVDWYLVKNNTMPGPAVVAGNELIRNMINLFPLLTKDAAPALQTQLRDLQRDMEGYLHVFQCIGDVNDNGWFGQVKVGDPSIFATTGNNIDLRAWVASLAKERGIHRPGINTFIQVIAGSLMQMDLTKYDQTQPVPALTSVVGGVPSMLWVVDYSARNKMTLMDAHIVGVQEINCPVPDKQD